MFTYGVPSLRPKRNPTLVSNVCEAEPIRTQRITANTFQISLTDKSTTRFLTGQSWLVLKWWYLGGGPERGFWRYFADRLNQKFSFVCGAVYVDLIPHYRKSTLHEIKVLEINATWIKANLVKNDFHINNLMRKGG